jgi:hypothetical protein
MTNYLLVYHGGGMPESEAARAKELAAWGSWFESLGAAVVDVGNPVGRAQTIDSSGAVREGGGANPSSGYTILQADSINEAVGLAKGCPVIHNGGSVEVAETFRVM